MRVTLPLIFAAVVLVGTSATLVLNVVVESPTVPSILFPIEAPDTTTASVNLRVFVGQHAKYATIAGMGSMRLYANTTGWYYYVVDYIGTLVRKNAGNASYEIPSLGLRIDVVEINETHAVIFTNRLSVYAVVASKVVFNGWIVYMPTYFDDDVNVINAISSWLNSRQYYNAMVFQPRDYFEIDTFGNLLVFFDVIDASGNVYRRYSYDSFPASLTVGTHDDPTTINCRIDVGDFYLCTTMVWLYRYVDRPIVSVVTAEAQ